jgi:RNA polymerase sigma-70 factor (ECF subfamily)
MNTEGLIPHLFRTEYTKIVSVLCKYFGLSQVALAEDIASDTFLTATQSWGVEGVPANPVAWLYQVAKNKAKNAMHRKEIFENKVVPQIKDVNPEWQEVDIDLSPRNIIDSQLQMMFAVCHPALPPEAQIGLSLRILSGFGIEEIARAFLTNKETINKRLYRAKEKLREAHIAVELPSAGEMDERLSVVLKTIYLLFNEGYYAAGGDHTLRKDLCLEAIRLCTMLIENNSTNKPAVNALMSLMCFHASRFDARIDKDGELVLYADQDASLWNTDLISKGGYFLQCASGGNELSAYHLEAAIAYWHTQQDDSEEKWNKVLQLYNRLLQLAYSPVAALNRTYAFSKVYGKPAAIQEAEKLNLIGDRFYYLLLGELYLHIDNEKAKQHFQRALSLAKTTAEKQSIQKKADAI